MLHYDQLKPLEKSKGVDFQRAFKEIKRMEDLDEQLTLKIFDFKDYDTYLV